MRVVPGAVAEVVEWSASAQMAAAVRSVQQCATRHDRGVWTYSEHVGVQEEKAAVTGAEMWHRELSGTKRLPGNHALVKAAEDELSQTLAVYLQRRFLLLGCVLRVAELAVRRSLPESGSQKKKKKRQLQQTRASGLWHRDPVPDSAHVAVEAGQYARHVVVVFAAEGQGEVHFAMRKSFAAKGTKLRLSAGCCYAFFDAGPAKNERALTQAYHCPVHIGRGARVVLVMRCVLVRK